MKFPNRSFLRAAMTAALLTLVSVDSFHAAIAEIPVPTDAPKPLAPEESVKRFQVPSGFRLELIAAEPLVREPTGMCWDARGRLFVCELHGYNMDGQLDIEELNKTGELDRSVRRVRASEEIMQAAKQHTYGTVKLLSDTDGDGRMDHAEVFADKLPPCYGICPARDGVITVGSPDITFLADRDGDGLAEVREVLFTGFEVGPIERGINSPQWGLDDWIYVGCGHGSAVITGPHLAQPVKLPRTDFRIKVDGSAIEPILGGTYTVGFAFTERGDRFTIWTYSSGIFIPPIPWHYLARNPDFAPRRLEERIGDNRTYPTSEPHPWRTRRSEDPDFAAFYNKRNGVKETSPNGYFTSACSPLIYQSNSLPGLQGQMLTCEPAQNMVHRSVITRDGPLLSLSRSPGEEKSEFLTSTDQWFNPIALTHAPDGSVAIADFYREIIEDYSAIPRYLQQQYGLKNGINHGRIWRLVHQEMPTASPADMSQLTPEQLVDELASANFWRRQTARRLLTERQQTDMAQKIAQLVQSDSPTATVMSALYSLEALGKLDPPIIQTALASPDPGIRIHGLRLSEPWLDREPVLLEQVLAMTTDSDDSVVLQLALTLGESRNPHAFEKLAELARQRGDIRWMDTAIVSSLNGRAGTMLDLLLADEEHLGHASEILKPLTETIASRRDGEEISALLQRLSDVNDRWVLATCLHGLKGRSHSKSIQLSAPAVEAITQLASVSDRKVAKLSQELIRRLGVESNAERTERIDHALSLLADIQLSHEERLAALSEIDNENSLEVTQGLVAAVASGTPMLQTALLDALFSRQDRLAEIISALEARTFPTSVLTAIQRSALLDHPDSDLRQRAHKLLDLPAKAETSEQFTRYVSALKNTRDLSRGGELFQKQCAMCHQAHGVGTEVGPNLTAENKRAEETLIQDILSPSGSITAGYSTYIVSTTSGQVLTGLLTSESATSITLKQQEGKTHTILRKEIEMLKSSPVSLMPDNLTNALEPQDVADLVAWLKSDSAKAPQERK